MEERRRDHRIDVALPFLLTDEDGPARRSCRTIDISPTGMLVEIEGGEPPPPGRIVRVVIQGPTEEGWEHINSRKMRVVRTRGGRTGLTYTDLDPA